MAILNLPNQGYLTGFHLIPGRDDEVTVYLTHNTFGKSFKVHPLSIILDNKPFKSLGELCEFIASDRCKKCIGVARGVDTENRLDGTDICEMIELETIAN